MVHEGLRILGVLLLLRFFCGPKLKSFNLSPVSWSVRLCATIASLAPPCPFLEDFFFSPCFFFFSHVKMCSTSRLQETYTVSHDASDPIIQGTRLLGPRAFLHSAY
ncbi:hypothetical protein DEU56DRAFT_839819 [Suillus clintonianus]|uniref:uncharacterized protein n=1 Tax=Suillus clintonianus TaxID=1904413 RepID=UPI001B882C36|nr:uncharacterized protein DEU56DRAFT_839819 [Suillus clintonianus]KAG2116849.1 hypothetical protein DEU56DRAFT_839819 [Suillus clintonianus]